jgi:hypothetical protein
LLRDFTTDLTADLAFVRVTDPVFADDLTERASKLPAADFAVLLAFGLLSVLAALLTVLFDVEDFFVVIHYSRINVFYAKLTELAGSHELAIAVPHTSCFQLDVQQPSDINRIIFHFLTHTLISPSHPSLIL